MRESSGRGLSVAGCGFKEANELVRRALAEADAVEVCDVGAQRYLACAMPAGKTLRIFGTPGNDLACYLDGGTVEVFGNAQDQTGNTMNGGRVVIHGRCGDAAGYAMRAGSIFVRDGCGWRAGIHMKQFGDRRPVMVIGGDTGSFSCEYMAGGVFVALGRTGDYLARGMHGGVAYLKHPPVPGAVSGEVVVERVGASDTADIALLEPLLAEYNRLFADERGRRVCEDARGFYRLRPASARPYADLYA